MTLVGSSSTEDCVPSPAPGPIDGHQGTGKPRLPLHRTIGESGSTWTTDLCTESRRVLPPSRGVVDVEVVRRRDPFRSSDRGGSSEWGRVRYPLIRRTTTDEGWESRHHDSPGARDTCQDPPGTEDGPFSQSTTKLMIQIPVPTRKSHETTEVGESWNNSVPRGIPVTTPSPKDRTPIRETK